MRSTKTASHSLFGGLPRMYSESVLTTTQRVVLGLIEYGPASFAEAAESCRAQGRFAMTEDEPFRAAVIKLLCRGLIRPEGEQLAITIAGRVALADSTRQ